MAGYRKSYGQVVRNGHQGHSEEQGTPAVEPYAPKKWHLLLMRIELTHPGTEGNKTRREVNALGGWLCGKNNWCPSERSPSRRRPHEVSLQSRLSLSAHAKNLITSSPQRSTVALRMRSSPRPISSCDRHAQGTKTVSGSRPSLSIGGEPD